MSIRDEALRELSLVRDEASLQLHLLGMDTHDGWTELREKLDSFEQKLAQGGEELTEVSLLTARHLAQSARDFFKRQEHTRAALSEPVSSIMSRPVRTCIAEDTLNHAARLLWETNCGAVPVVAGDRTVLGIITDRDICMASYTQGRALSDLPVAGAMSKVVWSCLESEPISSALQIMQTHQVRRVPVIHEDGHLAGIVTLADVARWVHSKGLERGLAGGALANALAAISESSIEAQSPSHAAE